MLSTSSQSLSGENHSSHDDDPAEKRFCEFRRKVRDSELLSAAIVKLLRTLKYTGKLSIVLQNGEVLKSGYEEGYFRRKDDFVV